MQEYLPGLRLVQKDLVEASLAGLLMDDVVCKPALAEPGYLEKIHEGEKALFENSRTGLVAARYKPAQK